MTALCTTNASFMVNMIMVMIVIVSIVIVVIVIVIVVILVTSWLSALSIIK